MEETLYDYERDLKAFQDLSLLLWKISISLALVSLFGFCRPHRHTEWTQSDSWRFLTNNNSSVGSCEGGG